MSSPVPPRPTGLEHLTTLNPTIHLYTPPRPPSSASISSPSPTSSPTLILLFTWMSAPPRPISKYIATYNTLFPSTSLLLIRTSALAAVYHTRRANLQRLKPVLDTLLKLPANAKVLLHLFSNGGAFTTTLLLEEYERVAGRPLSLAVIVLDSSPGRARLRSTVRAFVVGLPTAWRRWKVVELAISAILALLFALYKAGYFLSGWILMRKWKGDLVTRTRKVLNDKQVIDRMARRLYIFSEGDDLVRCTDVEDHAKEAEDGGCWVRKERFGMESGHVGHMVVDGARYWGAIQKAWEADRNLA